MTESEFATEFKRLSDNFNTAYQTKYSTELARLFWAEVKNLNSSWFRFQIDMAIGDMKPLTLSQLRDSAIRKRNEIVKEKELKMMKSKYQGTGLGKLLKENNAESVYDLLKKAKEQRGIYE